MHWHTMQLRLLMTCSCQLQAVVTVQTQSCAREMVTVAVMFIKAVSEALLVFNTVCAQV